MSGVTIQTVAETGSTNADMLALAQAGTPEGVWLRAERQVAGRGRQGRGWVSPIGNLHASTIVRLRPNDPAPATLALVAAVAVDETIAAFLGRGAPLTIKWPNDVLLSGAKVAGMLLERANDAVVVGVGINLAHSPELPDRPSTSLAAHGHAIGPGAAAETLAETFNRWLGRWRGEGLEVVRGQWLARCHAVGTALNVRLPDGSTMEGLFEGLDRDGALVLRLATGERRAIHAADVFLI